MRNLSSASSSSSSARRVSSQQQAGHTPLAGSNQSRYKGLTPAPGYVKFSMWKRETEIPKFQFHDYLLQKIREQDPEKVWLKDVTNGRVETFGRVSSSVAKIASGLNKIGFGKRDVICMYCSNYVEYWLIALAAWSCGGCVMPVNCELDKEELEEQLIEAKAKILVCDDFNVEDGVDILKNTDILQHVIVIGMEGKGQGCIPINDLITDDGKSPPPKPNMVWDKDTIYLPFTSARDDGGARGIMHTNKSILSWFYSPENTHNHYLDQMAGDSLACGNWFFHLSGFYAVALSAIYGVSVYCISEYSDTAFLDMIVENRIQTATMYPWQIRLISQSPSIMKYDLSCLKAILTAGGVLSATIKGELMDRFPNVKYVREAYGLNECGLITLTYPREKKNSVTAAKSLEIPDDHVMPIGLPNMYSQIKITNRQSKEPVEGPDEQGEIWIRSPQCFTGYLNYRNNHKLFDSEEYFATGDLGYYDGQGGVYFVERIENLIHFWMYEVAPTILESRLLGSNNIVDAAVVGIPNKENGEVPRAFVVLRPGFEETEENLIGLMESRLQDHERIRGGLFFIQSIPRDENWKVLKDVLQSYKPNLAYEDEDATPAPKPSMGKSPKCGKKMMVVKELEKQPNGSFVAAAEGEENSPRLKRSAGGATAAAGKKSLLEPPKEAQDVFGIRNRGRRGSMEAIQEDAAGPSGGGGGGGGGRRRASAEGSRRAAAGAGGRRSSLEAPAAPPLVGSCGAAGSNKGGPGTFSYWLQVHVQPKALESVLSLHPAVDDCCVIGYHVAGLGKIPRAFVVLKSGYTASVDELFHFVNARLADTDRLRGGIVFVDKLAKDSDGRLMVNLDKYDKAAEGMDLEFVRQQPKIKT